ncbi:hypothetical protein I6A84_09590 [Frankia sp. CNm7]|uniref:Uncharacterized protein n=1 Tax=Frankia nepalensis TaxID=1836974 RepID=A0A937RQ03_9ACTN|nr:hypothetical protein [Frankia nepalensis]MBL7494881.1 hypothetical protein [Frankia nepalensis]MBL7514413.1 hypothetical protein [Frankia nepalensis]MBL7518357.1 hypothetical protein [Frankia nepalensis]MBL7632875.1 hypothetical protein [Frankia nepalensis]
MPKNHRQTGAKAASAAGKTLTSKSTPKKTGKVAAASALSQAPESTGQTGAKAASAAAKTLASKSATKAEKSAAASTLAQTPSRSKK